MAPGFILLLVLAAPEGQGFRAGHEQFQLSPAGVSVALVNASRLAARGTSLGPASNDTRFIYDAVQRWADGSLPVDVNLECLSIFDFDDTLFPTYHLGVRKAPWPTPEEAWRNAFDQRVVNILELASQQGLVAIVTNGGRRWVEKAASLFPKLYKIWSSLLVLYTREWSVLGAERKPYNVDPEEWKLRLYPILTEAISIQTKSKLKTIIAYGDQAADMRAASELVNKESEGIDHAHAKFIGVWLQSTPTFQQLHKEHEEVLIRQGTLLDESKHVRMIFPQSTNLVVHTAPIDDEEKKHFLGFNFSSPSG